MSPKPIPVLNFVDDDIDAELAAVKVRLAREYEEKNNHRGRGRPKFSYKFSIPIDKWKRLQGNIFTMKQIRTRLINELMKDAEQIYKLNQSIKKLEELK